jgi:hypothetical protein
MRNADRGVVARRTRTYDGRTRAAYTIVRPGVILSSCAQRFASVRPALHRASGSRLPAPAVQYVPRGARKARRWQQPSPARLAGVPSPMMPRPKPARRASTPPPQPQRPSRALDHEKSCCPRVRRTCAMAHAHCCRRRAPLGGLDGRRLERALVGWHRALLHALARGRRTPAAAVFLRAVPSLPRRAWPPVRHLCRAQLARAAHWLPAALSRGAGAGTRAGRLGASEGQARGAGLNEASREEALLPALLCAAGRGRGAPPVLPNPGEGGRSPGAHRQGGGVSCSRPQTRPHALRQAALEEWQRHDTSSRTRGAGHVVEFHENVSRSPDFSSEKTKNKQHLLLGQIPEISPDYGDATFLSGTLPAKTDQPQFVFICDHIINRPPSATGDGFNCVSPFHVSRREMHGVRLLSA